jgi:Gp49-like protein DUF891
MLRLRMSFWLFSGRFVSHCLLQLDCWPISARSLAGPMPIRSMVRSELRFEATDGEWRAAFAFDPERRAILLVAGDKSGGSQKRFYKSLIVKADLRFSEHLEGLKSARKGTRKGK